MGIDRKSVGVPRELGVTMRTMLPILAGLVLCSGLAACGLAESPSGESECEDRDGDGFDAATEACPSGRDCDDTDESIHPNATEICENDIDEDCSGDDAICPDSCIDRDRDGYGEGDGCRGPDCDDGNPDIHPGAEEICDDGIDQDCDGEDLECSSQCTDADRDGFGAEGANDACARDAVDCDDSNPDVHPEADEVCNGRDDNCNGEVDECPDENATCTETDDGLRCQLPLGAECSDSSLCPDGTRCDPQSGECRKDTNESCSEGECLEVLSCTDGTCKGEYCENVTCPDDKPECDDRQSRCVECAYWDERENWNCDAGEECIGNGWCGRRVSLTNDDPVDAYDDVRWSVLELSVALADCWNEGGGGASRQMCAGVETDEALRTIAEPDVRDAYDEFKTAYEDDELQHMSDEQFNELGDLLGDGLFDLNNLEWESDIPPASQSVCVWFDDHGTFGRSKLHVQECSEFELPN